MSNTPKSAGRLRTLQTVDQRRADVAHNTQLLRVVRSGNVLLQAGHQCRDADAGPVAGTVELLDDGRMHKVQR